MLLPYLFDATLNFSSSPFGLELPSSVVFFTQPGVCKDHSHAYNTSFFFESSAKDSSRL
jgi:hypothetical protein